MVKLILYIPSLKYNPPTIFVHYEAQPSYLYLFHSVHHIFKVYMVTKSYGYVDNYNISYRINTKNLS